MTSNPQQQIQQELSVSVESTSNSQQKNQMEVSISIELTKNHQQPCIFSLSCLIIHTAYIAFVIATFALISMLRDANRESEMKYFRDLIPLKKTLKFNAMKRILTIRKLNMIIYSTEIGMLAGCILFGLLAIEV